MSDEVKEDVEGIINLKKPRGRPKVKPEQPPKEKKPKGRPKLSQEQLKDNKDKRDEKKKLKDKNKVGRPRKYKDRDEYMQNQYSQRNARKISHDISKINNDLEKLKDTDKKADYLNNLLDILIKNENLII